MGIKLKSLIICFLVYVFALAISILICSKCSVSTSVICALLVVSYLYTVSVKQKEGFNFSDEAHKIEQGVGNFIKDV